ncbi:hypothetical protein BC6307_04980 [Sutcliffiella cohnii]|uniref:WYL domain-containing protein n=1 Tax=Sutcliffiella cohnii TaxID=33932 RepID=A0A223KMI7_9BACI|nr:hypothetical protein [Sutcliffiella cohnii]AST90682.1 hypothetical protein BC6307_04980 [Sutcliffiella cohnii]
MQRLLQRLHEENKLVDIIYEAHNGTITQRTIQIIKLEATYITAFCYLRNTNRTFKIENMLSVFPHKKIRKIS